MSVEAKDEAAPVAKKVWVKPSLTYVGHVGEVLQGGGGKLTPSPADPGETRKATGGVG